MEQIWIDLFNAAKKALKPRKISRYVQAGSVSAAIESSSGKIYVGVCVDTACTLGICAERNAIFNMLTNGEDKIKKILAISSKGKLVTPCGACREFITQLMCDDYQNIEVMIDYENNKVISFKDLVPYHWF